MQKIQSANFPNSQTFQWGETVQSSAYQNSAYSRSYIHSQPIEKQTEPQLSWEMSKYNQADKNFRASQSQSNPTISASNERDMQEKQIETKNGRRFQKFPSLPPFHPCRQLHREPSKRIPLLANLGVNQLMFKNIPTYHRSPHPTTRTLDT